MQNGPIKAVVDGIEIEFEFRDGVLMSRGKSIDASLVRVGPSTYSLLVDGRSYEMTIQSNGKSTLVTESGIESDVRVLNRASLLLAAFEGAGKAKRHILEIKAPMPGLVLAIEVEEGDRVQLRQGVVVLEAMKMENEIFSTGAGLVEKIHVSKGLAVTKGQTLITLAAD